jgi:hypothetical protein
MNKVVKQQPECGRKSHTPTTYLSCDQFREH